MAFNGLVIEEENIKFFFKYDSSTKDKLLHIWVRHLTTIENALDVFFENDNTTWNENHSRFESFSETHGLYWFWLEENKKVMIISCFNV
ncbi:MAG: hypothetical protein AABZ74_14555 [Cyanobacteriota bacterium]